MDVVSLQACRSIDYASGERAHIRDWAIVIPSYLTLVVWLAYLGYAALGALLTPSFDSPALITGEQVVGVGRIVTYGPDEHSSIPVAASGELYYWKFTYPDVIPEAVDLPIDLVNRVLYPPRQRPERHKSVSS
jgi:phosphatidylinositol glycan class P protein